MVSHPFQINYKTHDQFLETGQTERQLEDNLSRECVTYYCPGDLNKFKDRKSGTTSKAITYLTFSPDGNELLVNMGAEHIYLYDINNAKQPVVTISHLLIYLRIILNECYFIFLFFLL